MKKYLAIPAIALLFACNNSKKETAVTGETGTTNDSGQPVTGNATVQFTIDGKVVKLNGSVLVTKDKDKLQPGADHFCMLTASNGPNDEALILNFVMDTKPGTYPVVGMSFSRGPSDSGEVYGGLMGGDPKLTNYKVNLTDVKDLGSNGIGGHKWSISGNFEDLTIHAMSIMLMDKEKKHPAEVKIEKGSFNNLTFDDNWEALMEKATDQMKNK